MDKPRCSKNVLIAHKASKQGFVENTLESLKRMHQLGAKFFEIDCFLLKDGNIAVIHDKYIGKLTTGRGNIRRKTTLDLVDIYLKGAGFEKIPMLESIMEYVSEHKLHLMIEVKDKSLAIVEKIDAMIRLFGQQHFSIYSFHKKIIAAFLELKVDYPIHWNMDRLSKRRLQFAKKVGAAINLDGRNLSKSAIEQVKELNKPLHVYTINEKSVAEKLLSFGADMIITDTLFDEELEKSCQK